MIYKEFRQYINNLDSSYLSGYLLMLLKCYYAADKKCNINIKKSVEKLFKKYYKIYIKCNERDKLGVKINTYAFHLNEKLWLNTLGKFYFGWLTKFPKIYNWFAKFK